MVSVGVIVGGRSASKRDVPVVHWWWGRAWRAGELNLRWTRRVDPGSPQRRPRRARQTCAGDRAGAPGCAWVAHVPRRARQTSWSDRPRAPERYQASGGVGSPQRLPAAAVGAAWTPRSRRAGRVARSRTPSGPTLVGVAYLVGRGVLVGGCRAERLVKREGCGAYLVAGCRPPACATRGGEIPAARSRPGQRASPARSAGGGVQRAGSG